ncbi:MAG: DNA recombination protein RmuC, partial [Chloroflexota bacterium]|nr:DNA recombination protein RmuC [Chloroflexota bacterium]
SLLGINKLEIVLLIVLLVVSIVLLVLLLTSKRGNTNERMEQVIREEFRSARDESAKTSRELREEISMGQRTSTETLVKTIGEMGKAQTENLELVSKRIKELTESNEARIDRVRGTINEQLKTLQESNEKKLDQMRHTVDEKLHSTLEKRLGESFKLVSDRLEAVQRGLGEMQSLATGVGDLKRVLTNVKARGTWAEVQLGALLEQILTPDQYAKNVQTSEVSRETVEYAIRLPGTDSSTESQVWLPIDSKFPQEDYLRLLDATEAVDLEAVQKATADLLRNVHSSAKEISEKYLNPPQTTDFAILFLPTEGLYSEVLRQPGQVEEIQQKYRIVIAGPTTLAAILNSLRMGFQTLALEKRSHEVWTVLAAVKTEFGKFGEVLSKVKKQLDTASNTIDQTETRTRAMARKLRDVQKLPESESAILLGFDKTIEPDIIPDDNELQQ